MVGDREFHVHEASLDAGRCPDVYLAPAMLGAFLQEHESVVGGQFGRMAIEAGRIRARRYHRQHAAISLADCISAAAALAVQQPLATADSALANVVRAEGGNVHPLPDSKGRLP